MQTVADIGEFGLIRRLAKMLPARGAVRGVGDDCAVLPSGRRDRYLLFACDPVVEGVHYQPKTPARQVGWKAMARNLSDIAAMSGQPRWAVVSLGLRRQTPVAYVTSLYRGLTAAARQFECEIVGGDTTHVAGAQFIVVTILGEVERRRLTLRRGSKPGDVLFVTGKLGGSLHGKHLRFTPRIAEARWLTHHFAIHAMLDLSDGLASDLHRLAESSRVGVDIDSHRIPIAPAARKTCGRAACGVGRPAHSQALIAAISDGEDFELLFTIDAADAGRLHRKWPFAVPLTPIGVVTRNRSVLLDGKPLTAQGYDHFAAR